jgi:hypothetical protein
MSRPDPTFQEFRNKVKKLRQFGILAYDLACGIFAEGFFRMA